MADLTPDVRLILDIREQLIECYGEHVKPEYENWDCWEECEAEEFTPYDVASELLFQSFTGKIDDLEEMATWQRKFPEMTSNEHFQSTMAELYCDVIFYNPKLSNMDLSTIKVADGYLDVGLRPRRSM